MVMRVFPVVGITAPRLPLEKSYTFFIVSPLFGVRLPRREGPPSLPPGSVNHHHQRPENVRSNVTKRCLASAASSSTVSARGSFRVRPQLHPTCARGIRVS